MSATPSTKAPGRATKLVANNSSGYISSDDDQINVLVSDVTLDQAPAEPEGSVASFASGTLPRSATMESYYSSSDDDCLVADSPSIKSAKGKKTSASDKEMARIKRRARGGAAAARRTRVPPSPHSSVEFDGPLEPPPSQTQTWSVRPGAQAIGPITEYTTSSDESDLAASVPTTSTQGTATNSRRGGGGGVTDREMARIKRRARAAAMGSSPKPTTTKKVGMTTTLNDENGANTPNNVRPAPASGNATLARISTFTPLEPEKSRPSAVRDAQKRVVVSNHDNNELINRISDHPPTEPERSRPSAVHDRQRTALRAASDDEMASVKRRVRSGGQVVRASAMRTTSPPPSKALSMSTSSMDSARASSATAASNNLTRGQTNNRPGVQQVRGQDERIARKEGWIDPLSLTEDNDEVEEEEQATSGTLDAYTLYATNPDIGRLSSDDGSDGSHQENSQSMPIPMPMDTVALEAEVHKVDHTHDETFSGDIPESGHHGAAVKPNANASSRRKCIIFLVVLALAIAIVIGVVVGLHINTGGGGSETTDPPEPTSSPSEAPSVVVQAPTFQDLFPNQCSSNMNIVLNSQRFNQFQNLLLNQTVPDSPERKALCWLADIDQLAKDLTDVVAVLQRYALAVFYFSFPSIGQRFPEWLGETNECEWTGITCGGANRVWILEFLPSHQLELNGPLPSAIGYLLRLRVFTVEASGLSGSLPDTLFGLRTLRTIHLIDNTLSGTIPTFIGGLTRLQDLTLTGSHLKGTLPVELFDIQSLEQIALEDNEFSGGIPTEIGNLGSLKKFISRRVTLSGQLPTELGLCMNLEQLIIVDNQLQSTLPTQIAQLGNLALLNLERASIEGTIPTELGSLTSLRELIIQSNRGISGTLPSELGKLSRLESVSLKGLELTGSVPNEVCALRGLTLQNLETDCQVSCNCCASCGSE